MTKGMKYIPSNGGKWVYYDSMTGKMVHGEQYVNYDAQHTGWYLFDQHTGAMFQAIRMFVPTEASGFATTSLLGKWLRAWNVMTTRGITSTRPREPCRRAGSGFPSGTLGTGSIRPLDAAEPLDMR